jgi:hypothetical protein
MATAATATRAAAITPPAMAPALSACLLVPLALAALYGCGALRGEAEVCGVPLIDAGGDSGSAGWGEKPPPTLPLLTPFPPLPSLGGIIMLTGG